MRRWQLVLVVVAVVVLAAAAMADAKKSKKEKKAKLHIGETLVWSEPVQVLHQSNWTDLVVNDAEAAWIINFYSDNCKHCQALHPLWNQMAGAIFGLMKIGAVNCGDKANGQLCQIYAPMGHPSLVVFKEGVKEEKRPFQYRYERDPQGLIELVMGNVPRVTPVLTTRSAITLWTSTLPSLPRCLLLTTNAALDFRLNAIAYSLRKRIAVAQLVVSSSSEDLQLPADLKVVEGEDQIVCWLANGKGWEQGRKYGAKVEFPQVGQFVESASLPEPMQPEASTRAFHDKFFVEKVDAKFAEMEPVLVKEQLEEADGASIVQFCHSWMANCGAVKTLLPPIASQSALPVFWVDIDLKEGTALFDRLGFKRVPTTVILPGGGAAPVVWEGENKVEEVVKWANEWAKGKKPRSAVQPPKQEGEAKKEL